MSSKIIYLLYSIGVIINAQSTEPNVDNIPLTCFNDTDCNLSESINESTTATTLQNVSEDISKRSNTSAESTTVSSRNVTPSSSPPKSTIKTHGYRDGNCGCDLTVASCDINCCCDVDCKNLDTNELFSCVNDHPKVYDVRYCYDSSYIQYNSTRYLLEKLRDNLFCIVADNLPPVYSVDYDPIISNKTVLEEIIAKNKKSRFKWDQSKTQVTLPFNSDKHYRYGDVIWKLENSYIKKLEIPQTGFTGICSFKKSLKYLEDLKYSCLQISLENTNAQLFTKSFKNFTVIASPNSYNDSNLTSENQSCPTTICLPILSRYCFGSWNLCKNESSLSGNCLNKTCQNIVKAVRYVITHNGVKGINSIEVYFKLGNASKKFYQEFQVEYKWLRDVESELFHLSGNPGYLLGKPLIIGNLITNKTNGVDYSYVSVNHAQHFLSMPVSEIDDSCSKDHRYAINFGEDLKLRCKIELEVENFATNSCLSLQNRINDALLREILSNVTDIDGHSTYVAKLNLFNKNDTTNWAKIYFDRIPQNIITGMVIDDRLMCSGLVTSLRVDIVHRHLPEPRNIDNYKILGVSITFSEDSDFYWAKCWTENCVDLLSVDIISYVIFHDVSQPSKYFFAEGPNLDISLPHDFFYPFINNAHRISKGSYSAIICTCVLFSFTKALF